MLLLGRFPLRLAAADAFSGVSGRVFLPLRGFTAVQLYLATKHRLAIPDIFSFPTGGNGRDGSIRP